MRKSVGARVNPYLDDGWLGLVGVSGRLTDMEESGWVDGCRARSGQGVLLNWVGDEGEGGLGGQETKKNE